MSSQWISIFAQIQIDKLLTALLDSNAPSSCFIEGKSHWSMLASAGGADLAQAHAGDRLR
jgi:hypothetical protein